MWGGGLPVCGPPASFSVHRASSGFTPRVRLRLLGVLGWNLDTISNEEEGGKHIYFVIWAPGYSPVSPTPLNPPLLSPAVSVQKSRRDNVVHMWVKLKR